MVIFSTLLHSIIQKWQLTNKLTLNRKKTEYYAYWIKKRLDKILETPKIIYGQHQIKRVREKTVLGLIIDDQLKWDRHNDELNSVRKF